MRCDPLSLMLGCTLFVPRKLSKITCSKNIPSDCASPDKHRLQLVDESLKFKKSLISKPCRPPHPRCRRRRKQTLSRGEELGRKCQSDLFRCPEVNDEIKLRCLLHR